MRAALLILAMVRVASADGVAVTVGFSVEREVGNANGWFCDDPSLVEAALETRGETNVWVVKGVKPGTTQCRVGTDVTRASYVLDLTVRPAAPRPLPIAPKPVVAKPAAPAAPATKPTTAKPVPAKAKPTKRRPRKPRKPRAPN